MVIGNGMIAQRFASYATNDDHVIFASGVSNSRTKDDIAYERETALLSDTIKKNADKTIVYFSTCSIYDPAEKDSRYVAHKLTIEELIKEKAKHYYIFRVSNLAGRSANHNTVLNFFYFHIVNKINFDLWVKTSRNLVDVDDMFRIVDQILKNKINRNSIINIANPESYSVEKIISAFETISGIKANYIPIQKGVPFAVDVSLILPIIDELGIRFDDNYLTSLLKKYYPAK